MPRLLAVQTNNQAIKNRQIRSPTSLLKPIVGDESDSEVGDLPEISGSFWAEGVKHRLFHFFHYLPQWNLNAINYDSISLPDWLPCSGQ